jgi:hypothetical protein
MPLPDSLPWMEGADSKINRAQEHLDAFAEEGRAFLKTSERLIVPKKDAESTWLVYAAKDPYPPVRLSAIMGDCIANMRSALDNLVCGLARTKKPRCRYVGIRFPIYGKPELWQENWKSDLKGVPASARAIIKRLQPCFRPDGLADKDPLLVLNQLSNMDKHRAILLTTIHDHHVRFVVHAKDGTEHFAFIPEPIRGGDIATIPLDILPNDLSPNTHVQSYGASVISFHEGPLFGESSAYEVLLTCLEYIKDSVIPGLKPFFG